MPTKHWPYPVCPETGRGPGDPNTYNPKLGYGMDRRRTERQNDWSCHCGKDPKGKKKPGFCVCKFVGKVEHGKKQPKDKKFQIDLAKKKKYNRLYKKWVKAHQQRSCKGIGKGRFPRQGSGLPMPKIRERILKRIRTRRAHKSR